MSLSPAEKSWVLYDVANSAFVLVVVTTVMPIFFKEIVAAGTPPHLSTAWWGYANSLSSALLVLLAPVCGTIADYDRFKKRFILLFLLTGVAATFLLSFSGPGAILSSLLLYVVARTAWGGANVFYDSLLTDVTTPDRYDRISTLGYAWGYIGSVVPFVAVILLLLGTKQPADTSSIPLAGSRWGFVVVSLWWLLFSIPLLRNVTQRFSPPLPAGAITTAMQELRRTFSHVRTYRNPFLFLLSYFFFIDGVDTIITMAVAYGVDLGLGSSTLILAILVIQIVAFPSSLLWGRLSDTHRIKPLLLMGIGIYAIITLLAFMMPSLSSLPLKRSLFWLTSLLVATSMGGIQALSRSFFARLIPPEHSAEFFGFFNISGKFATITGPALVAFASEATGSSRYGILTILFLFGAGALILPFVQEERK